MSIFGICFIFSVAEVGRDECAKDSKFWINYETWEQTTYGAHGPFSSAWDKILSEE